MPGVGVKQVVPISGGLGRTTGRGRGGSGLCARSRVAARGLSGVSGPDRSTTAPVSPLPVPLLFPPLLTSARPGAWEAPGPLGRTLTRSMPRVRVCGEEELGGFG